MSEVVEESSSSGPKPVKLPYFHRTLSPHDAALIGDIAPKPISNTSDNGTTASAKLSEGSAWNSAKTWEERDCTAAAKALVKESFSTATDSANSKFSNVQKVEGHASITHVRGRARYMYEWSLSVDFEIDGAKGTATVSDLINDLLDDVEIEIKWKGTAPTREAGKGAKEALRKDIVRRMNVFEDNFRKLGN